MSDEPEAGPPNAASASVAAASGAIDHRRKGREEGADVRLSETAIAAEAGAATAEPSPGAASPWFARNAAWRFSLRAALAARIERGSALRKAGRRAPGQSPASAPPPSDPETARYAIALRGVARAYKTGSGALNVLKDADLAVAPGEMVAIVAPSGAGKSTLLHLAGLLERPDTGEVFICGEATSGMADDARTSLRRTRIGFVFQFHHLLPEFSALENVVLPQMIAGLPRREAERRAGELLRYLRVDHRATHRPGELSGGEQQRVAIARAVANAPRVLLADEPTGNLDPKTAGHVFDALKQLVRESGLAALIATHNFTLASGMDRAITIEDGAIVPAKLGLA